MGSLNGYLNRHCVICERLPLLLLFRKMLIFITYDSHFRLLCHRRSARPHPDLARVRALVGRVGLEQWQSSVPQIVEAEPDASLLQGFAILQPDQLHFEERTSICDTLELSQTSSLHDDRVLGREKDLRSHISSVVVGDFEEDELGILVLSELSVRGSGPEIRI